jgi:ParB family chromosome partitioning protein
MYDDAIRQGLYPSLRRLSDSLGVNLSDASRAVQLAKLPPEVVAAFASPLDLQVRWAKPLADAMQRDPDGLLQRARALAATQTKRNPSAAFAELLGQQASPKATETPIMLGKRKVAVLRVEPSGRLIIDFEPGTVTASRSPELAETIKAFLSSEAA